MGDVAEERQLSVTIKKERTYENNKVSNVRVIVTPATEGEDFENDFICTSEEWIKLNDGLGSVYMDFKVNFSNYGIFLQYVSEETMAYFYQYDGTIDITEIGMELYEPIGWEKPKKIKDGYVTLEDGQELPVIPAKYEGKTPVNVTNLEKMDNAIAYLFEHGVFNGGSSLQEETNSLKIKELQSKVDDQGIDIENIEVKNTEQNDLITQLENKTIELQNKNNEQQELITELQTELNELKDNVLTNEVEGTNIYVDNSANARVLELEIDGNSYQEVRSGKNLFVLPESETKNGITYTKNSDGTFNISGTATAKTEFVAWVDYEKSGINILNNITYVLSTNYPENLVYFQIATWDGTPSSPTWVNTQFDVNANSTKTFNATTAGALLRFNIYVKEGVTVNLSNVKVQLEENTVQTSWEQYGASPSPDYPSEVEVVKGYNLLELSEDNHETTTNSSTNNNCTITFNKDSLLVDTSNMPSANGRGDWFYVPLEIGKDYTLSWGSDGNFTNIRLYKLDKTTSIETSSNATGNMTINATENGCYFRVWASGETIARLDYAMINEGTTPKPYVPYKNIGIKIIGKNLFNFINMKPYNGQIVIGDNSIKITNNGTWSNLNTNVYLEIGKTYTFKCKYSNPNKSSLRMRATQIKGTRETSTTTNESGTLEVTFTATQEKIELKLDSNYSNTVNTNSVTFSNIQLEEGSVSTPYELYQENITYIDLQKNNLLSLIDGVYSSNGVDATVSNGIVTLNGTATANSFIAMPFNFKFLANKTYTLLANNTATSNSTNGIRFMGETTTLASFGNVNSYKTITFTEDKEITDFTIRSDSGTTYNNFVIKPAFYEGVEAEDNWEICKVGDIKDELDLNTGILTKRIGKMVLDENDGWYKSSIANIDRYGIDLNTLNITNFEEIQMLCNYFKYTTNQIVMKGTFKIINNHLYIDFAEYGTSTLAEFKVWLSENPVTVYYQLETPYEVQLGKIEMPKTINHVTNISLLATLESNMKLKYVRSTNVVIDNLAKAIVALGGEV